MQVVVPTKPFRRRLALLARVVPKKILKPVLNTIRLEVDGQGGATLAVTDLTSWVRVRAPILRIAEGGAVLLPRAELLSILSHTAEAELQLRCDAEDFQLTARAIDPAQRLIVSGLRSEATLRTFRPEDFPRWEQPEASLSHELQAGQLQRLIRTTAFATDAACTRYTLGGCQVEFTGEGVELVATDGLRLAHAWEQAGRCGPSISPAAFQPGDRSQVLAPVIGARSLRLLNSLLQELCNPLEQLRLGWKPDARFHVQNHELHFASRQLPGRFPNWAEVFPEPRRQRARWPRADQLAQAIKQVRALAAPERRTCTLGLRPGRLAVRVGSSGESTIEVPCSYEGERIEADFNPDHFLDVLAALGARPIELELHGPDIPAILLAEGFRYCLQPRPSAGSPRPATGGAERP